MLNSNENKNRKIKHTEPSTFEYPVKKKEIVKNKLKKNIFEITELKREVLLLRINQVLMV
jgi:hypothetical protein